MGALNIPLFVKIAVLVGVFGAGWGVNGWRMGQTIANMERAAAQAQVVAQAEKAEVEKRYAEKLKGAYDDAKKREATIRADAAAVRRTADRLRDDLADIRRNLPEATIAACRVRADTVADLLGRCAGRYTDLAERADRHVNDVKTLTEAWPK